MREIVGGSLGRRYDRRCRVIDSIQLSGQHRWRLVGPKSFDLDPAFINTTHQRVTQGERERRQRDWFPSIIRRWPELSSFYITDRLQEKKEIH